MLRLAHLVPISIVFCELYHSSTMLDVPCVCVSSDEVTNTQRDSHCFEIMEHTLAPFYGHHSFGIFIQNV